MLTWIEPLGAGEACQKDQYDPVCRRGVPQVVRFAVMAVMAMVLGLAGFVGRAQAVTVTDTTPTSAAFTASTWTNPNNALSQDDNYATWKNTDQSYLVLTGFDFSSIPDSAQIDGVTILVRGLHSSGTANYRDYVVGLTKNATAIAGTEKNSLTEGTTFATSVADYTLGANNDLWGTTWTATEIKSANFGVMLTDNNGTQTSTTPGYSIDVMYITVDYTITCSETTPSSIIWNGTNTAAGNFNAANFVTLTDIVNEEYQVTAGSPASAIDLGHGETGNCNSETFNGNMLYVDGNNPANATGTIDSIKAEIGAAGGDIMFFTCVMSGNNCTVTDVTPWQTATAGQVNSWSGLSLSVNAGDLLGFYYDNLSGRSRPTVCRDSITGVRYQFVQDSPIPAAGQLYTVADGANTDALQIYATGSTPGETIMIPWNVDPQEASAVLTDGNSYNLYARGNDSECNTTYYGDPAAANTTADGILQNFTWSSETTPPIAGAVTVAPDSGTQVPAAFTITTSFTDNETAVSSCDYTLNGGSSWSAGTVSGSGPYSCAANITGQVDGASLTINMRATSGGGTSTATAISRTVDAARPTVSIVVAGSSSGTPVSFTVTFSESVTAFTAADVVLGGTAGATTANISGSGSSYTVDVTGMTADGTITMDIPADSAFDAVGNGNTAATQAMTSWVSCAPTVTQITVSSATNPINYPASTSSISLAVTGGTGTISSTQWSDDNGTTWNSTATVYTAPAQTVGAITISGRAIEDNCLTTMATANTVTQNFDTRTPYIEPGTASSAQYGLDKVRITMPYSGLNDDSSASVSVAYDLNGAAQTQVSTNPVIGTGPAIIDLGVFSTGDAITNIVVTYTDTRWSSAPGNAVQNLADITMVSWADNNLLHNSNRFPGTSKHGGDWGTLTGYAGGIVCATCHGKNTGNVKRVRATISYPDGSSMPGGGSIATVNLQSLVDGSSDFGDDNTAPRSSSNKVCEVCHTYDVNQLVGTRFHAANQQVTTGHYDNADCIKCHEHKVGFKASCDNCHASPPINNATDLVKDGSSPGDATGSLTVGKHNKHANTLAYGCNTCHSGWESSGEMPNGGQINVGIMTPGNNGGTYDGRAGGGGYNADLGTGTTVTTGGALTCAIYCHGNTIGGTISTAVWNDAATISCGDCHKGTATQMQAGALGSHTRHAGNSTAATYQLNLTCDNCHGTVPVLGDTHMDGLVAWDVTALNGSTPTYAGAANGSAGPAPTTYDSCANVYCHSDVQNDGASAVSPTFAAPTWGGTVACGDCHGDATGRPTTGSHTKHNSYVCSVCHTAAGDETARHADSEIDIDIDNAYGASAAYSQSGNNPAGNGYGSCSNVSCHGASTPTWGGTVACGSCHGTVGAFNDNRDGAPPVDLANLSGSYEAGKHQKHLNVSMANTSDYCNLCHNGAGYGTAKHADGTVDMVFNAAAGGSATWADSGINVAPGGTCGSLDANSCHGGINWDPALTISCNTCHGFGGTDPNHVSDSRGISGTNCEHCHETGHPQGTTSANSILIANNLTVGINYKSGGIHLLKTIQGVANTTEAETCWSCHDAQGTQVSEWGVNNNANTGGLGYDYGTLSTSDWTAATWTSGTADFSYKTGAIQSTHSVNSAGTAAVTGSDYAKTETKDIVDNIRCSYCHDVHDRNLTSGDSVTGQPYLRGTWKGNPYNEDGAPQSGVTTGWANNGTYGEVPRASTSTTNNGGVGGYWIDENSGDPNNGESLDSTASLCKLCHSQGYTSAADIVNNMDYTTGENLWLGTNGHSNAVLDGDGTYQTNIFTSARRGLADADVNGTYTKVDMGLSSSTGWARSYRGDGGYNYNPTSGYWQYSYQNFAWSVTVDDATTDTNYHNFNCGKCHNPHASRLPKLMITNCMDTRHNDWDDDYQASSVSGDTFNGAHMSQWPSAQNCHRRGDPAEAGGDGTSLGTGWNKVTPW